jgi:hypothetical protein
VPAFRPPLGSPASLALPAFPVALVAFGALAGCARGCHGDHPKVPYAIGEGGTLDGLQEDAGVAANTPPADAAPFEAEPSVVAPANATRWRLGGLDLEAPAGRIFLHGLAGDFDGDGKGDALVIVAPDADAGPSSMEVVHYRGGSRGAEIASTLVAAPLNGAGEGDGCAPVRRLARVGKRSAAVELGADCSASAKPTSRAAGAAAAVDPRAPDRWFAVVAFDPAAQVHFSALVADPPGTPKLTLDADGADRDNDGIDDVTLQVSIEGGGAPFEPMPRATGLVRWFDRRAGMSRDPDEPDASLRALAGASLARASKAASAPKVLGEVSSIKALFAAICAEGGAPRLANVVGAGPVACGPSRALEEAGLALVRAHATLGDPVGAAAALDRATQPPASRTPVRVTEGQAWVTAIAPILSGGHLRALAAVPKSEPPHPPSWGPLAFEPSGKLLVRTPSGVVRVDPATGDEADAPEVAPWPSNVVAPLPAAGEEGVRTGRFTGAFDPCDGFALHAGFSAAPGDGDAREVPLPVAPPLGPRCASKGEPVPTTAIAWGSRGLEAIVTGEPLLVAPDLAHASLPPGPLDQPFQPGSPRSPNGKGLVVPTALGILVRGSGSSGVPAPKSHLFRAKELEGGYLELRDCAVSDDLARIACTRGGRAFAGIWDLP